jgi:hypothetical protein
MSDRVCSDLESYCDPGYRCTSNNKCERDCGPGYVPGSGGGCRPSGSVDCGNGRHCDAGEICAKGDTCIDVMSERVCGDLKSYCDPGYMCTVDRRCVRDSADTPSEDEYGDEEEDEDQYIALVATNSGLFYGYAIAPTREEALAEARSTCNIYKANTASTAEERAEACEVSVYIRNGCVALSRSHDMFYGAPDTFSGGMATDVERQAAINESFQLCKNKGGGNCFVVIESVKCTDFAMEQ